MSLAKQVSFKERFFPTQQKEATSGSLETSSGPVIVSLLSPNPQETEARSRNKLNSVKLLSREEAETAVNSILTGQECLYHLCAFSSIKGKKLKSAVYGYYELLCHINTKSSAGWAVCKYLRSGTCTLDKGCQRFDTENGTTNMTRHQKKHSKGTPHTTLPLKLGKKAKRELCRAATIVVVEDIRPFSFVEGEGMKQLLQDTFQAGKDVAPGETIDTEDLFPSARAVRDMVGELCTELRNEFRTELGTVLEAGGGMSIDGVTMKTQDKHFYDLTIYYFYFGPKGIFTGQTPILVCRTIVLAESEEVDAASNIKSLINHHLHTRYHLDLEDLAKSFTLVTDWAAVMPNIVGASVSENVAPLDEKWMGCIVHQLNTIMKSCLNGCEQDPSLLRVIQDLTSVKSIVRIFKQSRWNHELADGFHLIQEIETRFGTTHSVAERFVKAGLSAFSLIDKHDSATARAAKDAILMRKDPGGNIYGFPCIEAIVDACDMIVYAQTQLETSMKPTMHKVLPLIQTCKTELARIEEGGLVNRGFSRG